MKILQTTFQVETEQIASCKRIQGPEIMTLFLQNIFIELKTNVTNKNSQTQFKKILTLLVNKSQIMK